MIERLNTESMLYNATAYENVYSQRKIELISQNMAENSRNIEKERFAYFDKLNEQSKLHEKENRLLRI